MVTVKRGDGAVTSAEPVQPFDEQGWWWPYPADAEIPAVGEALQAPDNCLPGRLRVDHDGAAQLELFGAPTDPFSEGSRDTQAIVGQTVSGRLVSVLRPRQAAMRGTLGGASTELWLSDLVVVGVHARTESDVICDSCKVQLHGLREWLTDGWYGPEALPVAPRQPRPHATALERRRYRGSRRGSRRKASRSRSKRRAMAVRRTKELNRRRVWEPDEYRTVGATIDRVRITLEMRERGHTSTWIEQTERWGGGFLSFTEPTTLVEVEQDWLAPLTDMLAFMTGRPSVITDLKLGVQQAVDAFMRPAMRGRTHWTLDIAVYRRRPEPGRAPQLDGTLPLPASAAASERSEFLRRWFAEYRAIGRVGRLLFGTLQGRDQWPENELLNLVSFAEAYHEGFYDYPAADEDLNSRVMREVLNDVPGELQKPWRDKLTWATRLTQRQRLIELVTIAEGVVPQLEPFAENLVPQLTQTRNFLTHWGKRGSHVVEGYELLVAIERLLVVLRANLLWHMGIDEDCIQLAVLRGDARVGVLKD